MSKVVSNVWKVEFVERGKSEASSVVYSHDTFVAGTFADAYARAEKERKRYRRAVKIKSLVAITELTT